MVSRKDSRRMQHLGKCKAKECWPPPPPTMGSSQGGNKTLLMRGSVGKRAIYQHPVECKMHVRGLERCKDTKHLLFRSGDVCAAGSVAFQCFA